MKKGFTLIELLIVISVIGVLAGVLFSVIDAGVVRGRARDAQRASDLGKIQNALELFYAQNRRYPNTCSVGADPCTVWWNIHGTGAGSLGNILVSGDFINRWPEDPEYTTGDSSACDNPTVYRYNYLSNGSFYILTAIMENPPSAEDFLCTGAPHWPASCAATSTAGVCYAVTSP